MACRFKWQKGVRVRPESPSVGAKVQVIETSHVPAPSYEYTDEYNHSGSPPSAPSDKGNKPWVLNTRRGTLPTSTLVKESQGKIVPYNYRKRSERMSVCEAVNTPAHTRQDFKQVVGH